jgi:two-component system, chemotaxis family, sensor histidine kinase and response regulator WspE
MSDLDDLSIYDMFRMEAEEQVEQLQSRLLALKEGDANETALRSLMRCAHSLKGAARVVGLTSAVRLTHAMEERFVAAQQGHAITQAEVDILLRANDLLRSLASTPEDEAPAWSAGQDPIIDDLITQLTGTTSEPTPPVPESPPATNVGGSTTEANPTPEPPSPHDDRRPTAAHDEKSTGDMNLRITSQRFDLIIARSSDNLVQAQSLVRLQEHMQRVQHRLERLVRTVEEKRRLALRDPEKAAAALNTIIAQGERDRFALGNMIHEFDRMIHSHELNAERLHQEVLHARLRPFGDVVPNLRRLVRDTAAEMGKKVSLVVTGERTEVDRDILEKLRAPLEHLLRNALDHGLETPAQRLAAGKKEEGTIRLRATHANGRLAITLADDGAGVSIASVSQKAIERGLVRKSVASLLSEAEILEFLFLPGFSTRTEVTEISGRGFGLDVVQSTVHESGGSVRIENSPGLGTTFHLVLPVTRSLLRVMRVEIENEVYAIPLTRLSRIAALTIGREPDGSSTVEDPNGGEATKLPVIHMMDALQNSHTPIQSGPATILFLLNEKGREAPIAFQIDRVVDETTVAVRQLDPRLGRMAAIAAVTLTEQNVPMLIVEPDDVLRLAQQAQRRAIPTGDASTTTRGRVLVVDDSATVRQMLRRTLLRARYHVATAEHGAEAWNLLQIESFDLLVSDVDMPEMNGIELVEHVRANSRLAAMPIILLSYKGRDEDRRRGLEAGADAYVTKGEFQEQSFLQTVTDLVGPAELPEA